MVNHYNLQVIIALGFKIDNEKAIAFRKWTNHFVILLRAKLPDKNVLQNRLRKITELVMEENQIAGKEKLRGLVNKNKRV